MATRTRPPAPAPAAMGTTECLWVDDSIAASVCRLVEVGDVAVDLLIVDVVDVAVVLMVEGIEVVVVVVLVVVSEEYEQTHKRELIPFCF